MHSLNQRYADKNSAFNKNYGFNSRLKTLKSLEIFQKVKCPATRQKIQLKTNAYVLNNLNPAVFGKSASEKVILSKFSKITRDQYKRTIAFKRELEKIVLHALIGSVHSTAQAKVKVSSELSQTSRLSRKKVTPGVTQDFTKSAFKGTTPKVKVNAMVSLAPETHTGVQHREGGVSFERNASYGKGVKPVNTNATKKALSFQKQKKVLETLEVSKLKLTLKTFGERVTKNSVKFKFNQASNSSSSSSTKKGQGLIEKSKLNFQTLKKKNWSKLSVRFAGLNLEQTLRRKIHRKTTSFTRIRNRCVLTAHPHTLGKLGISRHVLRSLAGFGEMPGLTKR